MSRAPFVMPKADSAFSRNWKTFAPPAAASSMVHSREDAHPAPLRSTYNEA